MGSFLADENIAWQEIKILPIIFYEVSSFS